VPTRKTKPDEKVVHLILNRKLWNRVRAKAAGEDRTAVALVREALRAYLKGGKR